MRLETQIRGFQARCARSEGRGDRREKGDYEVGGKKRKLEQHAI